MNRKSEKDKAQSSSPKREQITTGAQPQREPNAADPSSAQQSAFSLRKTAHDLRNALNVMRNAAYLLRRKLVAAGGEHVDLVDMIEESVQSAEKIATQIMDQAVEAGEPPTSRSAPKPN